MAFYKKNLILNLQKSYLSVMHLYEMPYKIQTNSFEKKKNTAYVRVYVLN